MAFTSLPRIPRCSNRFSSLPGVLTLSLFQGKVRGRFFSVHQRVLYPNFCMKDAAKPVPMTG